MPPRSKHIPSVAAPTREPLTPEQLTELHKAMQNMLGGREPRDFQVEMVRAQEEGQDALCHAATGSGKTAIAAGPYALAKNQGRITFMVSPLIGLQNEMVSRCLLSPVYPTHAYNRLRPSRTISTSQP
jgi:superfamily II DNA or RNA helicase